MTISLQVTDELPKLQPLFAELKKLGAHFQPLLKKIAFLGENSTRERFGTQTGPDGQRWKPSLRVQLYGGKTLTKDGHLGDSITSRADDHSAEWGSNRIYAAIHQFGGTITAKTSKGLRFQIPGLGWMNKPSVTITARPYLGINSDDQDDMLDLVNHHISNLIRTASPGGA